MSLTGGIRVLAANQPADRFYRGGARIAAFRGHESAGDRIPEDWLASTVSVYAEREVGLTVLDDGMLLRDAIERHPVPWLGEAHVDAFGPDACLLVKLLDAGERLPVHSHPSDEFAAAELGLAHGKAEAWLVLEGGLVHVGFRRAVGESELRRWVEEQDADALLGAMHHLELTPGDTLFVPAGVPHAIGAGLFVVELQEPADVSVLLEWTGFDIDGRTTGQLGLGLDRSLRSVDRSGWAAKDVAGLRGRREGRDVLPAGSHRFFRAEWREVRGFAVLPAGFAVVVVVAGSGVMRSSDGLSTPVTAGATLLVPFESGDLRVDGDVQLIVCRPPFPPPSHGPIGVHA